MNPGRIAGWGYEVVVPDLYADGGARRCLVATMRSLMTGTGKALVDIETSRQRLIDAGGQALSEGHGNSRHEDTEGNGSVYVKAPWGMLIELQALPHGHYYGEDSEADVWTPPTRG
mgnify:CR=1 FL=1